MSLSATTALFIVVVCSALYNSEAALQTLYAEKLCYQWPSGIINLGLYGTGILASYSSEQDFDECTIRLRPEAGGSVVLSVYRLNLGPQDQLIIEDSEKFKVALLGESDFPDQRKSFTSDGVMTLYYSRNGVNDSSVLHTRNKLRFSFVFTQVHDGPCRYGEFECRNKKCISRQLLCDRYNHCGDNSDQENCSPKKDDKPEPISHVSDMRVNSYSKVWIVSIAVSSTILLIIIIVFVVVVVRNNRRKKEAKQNAGAPATVDATVPAQSPTAPPASLFGRIRDSFRRNPSHNAATQETGENKKENYQVPSMYPQIHSAPHLSGVDNPEFKADI